MNTVYIILAVAAGVYFWPKIKALGTVAATKLKSVTTEEATVPAAGQSNAEDLAKYFSQDKYKRVAFLMALRQPYLDGPNPDEYAVQYINYLIRLETNTEDGSEYIEEEKESTNEVK